MKKELEYLAKCVNRRLQQEEFLFDLCGKDFWKLLMLEAKIKSHFIMYCPGDRQEVERIMSI